MKLAHYPNPCLRVTARPVERIDEKLLEAIPRMFEIMYRARGLGLAAPQVGLDLRLVVAALPEESSGAAGGEPGDPVEHVFINPEILERSGEIRETEGCLSFPGIEAMLTRAEKVRVRYTDLKGRTVERSVEGLEAKLFQHEIDHLNGELIIDKMTPADRKQWASRLKELEEAYEKEAGKRARAAR